MAKDELQLIEYYYGNAQGLLTIAIILKLFLWFIIENKGWELVDEAKRYGDEAAMEMEDSIFFNIPRDIPKPAPASVTPPK